MAPVEYDVLPLDLAARDYYCGVGYVDTGDGCRAYSNWSYWGRWVFSGVILVIFLLLLSAFAARRRRRAGAIPYYGTGWMAPHPKYGESQQQQQQQQQQQHGYYQPPPPRYSAAPQYPGPGGVNQPTNGYFGNQEGIQLQQPPSAYNRGGGGGGGDHVYEPPAGAPPAKN